MIEFMSFSKNIIICDIKRFLIFNIIVNCFLQRLYNYLNNVKCEINFIL